VRGQHSAFSIQVEKKESPNFNNRDPAVVLEYVVLHYTGMGAEEWIRAVCDPSSELSAHYLIDEEGRVMQFVGENKRAWHAGKSYWRGITDMNSASIGIELVNPGHDKGYRQFPAAQIAALKALATDLVRRHGLRAEGAFLAHSDIAPTRKKDPGELFPWGELAVDGLGLWPDVLPMDYRYLDECDAVDVLEAIGYETSDFPAALTAFQRRFFPDNLTGLLDDETVARMRALKRQGAGE
jgi:N-acetylmuramoyl-L-alanine amidase